MARRMTVVVPATLILMILVFAPVVLGSGGEEHAAADAHVKPELLHWDFGTALWTIFVFIILLTILRLTAWKPILSGLNQREEFIRNSLADAKREREEAERLLSDYTARLEKASEEAGAVVEEARRDAEETRKRIHAEAKSEGEAMVDRAKREIALARDEAVRQLHEQTIMLATNVAAKMIHKEMNPADHRELLNESLEELGALDR